MSEQIIGKEYEKASIIGIPNPSSIDGKHIIKHFYNTDGASSLVT